MVQCCALSDIVDDMLNKRSHWPSRQLDVWAAVPSQSISESRHIEHHFWASLSCCTWSFTTCKLPQELVIQTHKILRAKSRSCNIKEIKGLGHSVSCTPSIKVPPNFPCSYPCHTRVSCRESAALVLLDNHWVFVPNNRWTCGCSFCFVVQGQRERRFWMGNSAADVWSITLNSDVSLPHSNHQWLQSMLDFHHLTGTFYLDGIEILAAVTEKFKGTKSIRLENIRPASPK